MIWRMNKKNLKNGKTTSRPNSSVVDDLDHVKNFSTVKHSFQLTLGYFNWRETFDWVNVVMDSEEMRGR